MSERIGLSGYELARLGLIKPVLTSISGVDGAGKDTARTLAMEFIPKEVLILYIGKPSLILKDGKEIPLQFRITRVLDEIHRRADLMGNKKLINLANVLNVMFMWRYQEPYWSKRLNPSVILSIRDAYGDPSAYAPFYMPGILGRKEIPKRIKTLNWLTRSPYRHLTLYIDVPPEEAVRRINQRVDAERGKSGLDRPQKWVHQHENIDGISQIRDEFLKVLNYLEENCGTRVVRVDGTQAPVEVAKQIAYEINLLIPLGK